MMEIEAHRSLLFVFAIDDLITRRKVFQIGFTKSDGSIFLNTPYFDSYEGIVAHVELPPFQSPEQDIKITETGKVSSHLVKFSYHPSGTVLFSKTGKVRSEIRKEAYALDNAIGHLCSFQLQGLSSFKQLEPKDEYPSRSDRQLLGFEFPEPGSDAYRVDIHQYSEDEINHRLTPGGSGPILLSLDRKGILFPSFLISSPIGYPRDNYYLIIKCTRTALLDKDSEKIMTFIGGFDESAKNPTISTSCLMFAYPARNVEDLKRTIGSIDLNPDVP